MSLALFIINSLSLENNRICLIGFEACIILVWLLLSFFPATIFSIFSRKKAQPLMEFGWLELWLY